MTLKLLKVNKKTWEFILHKRIELDCKTVAETVDKLLGLGN